MSYRGFRFGGTGAVAARPSDKDPVDEERTWARDRSGSVPGTDVDATWFNRLRANLENLIVRLTGSIAEDGDYQLANALGNALDDKAPAVHDHDDRYYTEAEVNGLFATLAAIGAANGIAPLDGDGKLPLGNLPAIAITDTFEVASQAAMLALTAERGDIAIRTDLSKCFALAADDPTTLANWKELKTPTDTVLAVAGLTGAISASSLKTALAIAVADITDASANGRSLISAANYAAMKALLAVAVADITDASANGRSLISAANYAAMRALLGLGSAAVLNAGTSANNLVQLDGSAKLPAIDGSQLTNLPALSLASQGEAEAAADNTKVMTPLRAKQAIAAWGHAPDCIFEDQKASGTDGGTATSGSRFTRTLNTTVRNVGSLGSLSSNQVTLPAGTYYIEWGCFGYRAGLHKSWLRNVTDGADVGVGSNGTGSATYFGGSMSSGAAVVTIAGSKAFSIEQRVTASESSDGCGVSTGFGTEVYAYMRVWKVAA